MGVLKFYLISYLFSWFVWIAGAIIMQNQRYTVVLIAVGGLGPVIALLYALLKEYDPSRRRDFLKRMFRVKRVPSYLWLITILPIMIVFLSAVISHIVEPGAVRFGTMFLNNLVPVQGTFFIFHIFFGPLPEELAWRGYAYHELLKKGIIKAQIMVASLWALWHVPLFFIQDSYQAGLGLLTADFWMFFINIFASSFITGWLYLKSRHSIFVVFMFHYLVNVTGEIYNLSNTGELVKHILLAMIGIVFFVLSIKTRRTLNQFG